MYIPLLNKFFTSFVAIYFHTKLFQISFMCGFNMWNLTHKYLTKNLVLFITNLSLD